MDKILTHNHKNITIFQSSVNSSCILKIQNTVFGKLSAYRSFICANILRLWAFLRPCVFQDFCKRRSLWKHISRSNDTEPLAVDAFKKQCYMKVNRAIKWFLKRQCGTRELPASLWAELALRYGSGAQVGINAENNALYIFWGEHEKTKLAELESGASRDRIHEAVHYADINHLKTLRWPCEDSGIYLTRVNTFARSKPLI